MVSTLLLKQKKVRENPILAEDEAEKEGAPLMVAVENIFSNPSQPRRIFEDEAIRMAYERTVLKKQSMDWGYMNGILRRWHEKGLHTAAAIAAGDRDTRPRAGLPQSQTTPIPEPPQNQQDYLDRMNRLLEQMNQEG